MSNQIKNEQIELIPDKDGFLFEIEDYNYLLMRFCLWFMVYGIWWNNVCSILL
ncbi:hypothetical protein [Arcobacter sp.]|uniref:hypothetical protein n=1 Tax=Arcobacter sp. TaxID=1872629 RepID=UPI003C70D13C